MNHQTSSMLVVAAEESSCKYALRIIKKLNQKHPHVFKNIWGIGNKEMRESGFKSVARSEDIAVMGFFEVFKIQAKIREALKNVLDEVDRNPPQVALLLDFGGFNLHLARHLHQRNIPVVYYVLPKVWAWRKKRAIKIKNFVTHALAIHPFEEGFFAELDVRARFVGHPLLEEQADFLNSNFDVKLFRNKLGMTGEKVLGLMPGSRNSEISRHLVPMLDAAELVVDQMPSVSVAVLVAPAFEIEDVKKYIQKDYSFPICFIKEDSWKMVAACDYVLTASGTATLQVGLMGKPQLVVYKMNSLTAKLAKIFVKIKYFSLVNLILNKQSVKELFQEQVQAQPMAKQILELMQNEDKRQELLDDYQDLKVEMQKSNATDEVIGVLLQYQKNQTQEGH